MSTGLFGWELLYNSAKKELKNNADILVCFAHYVLITKGFQCLGIGEDKVLTGDESKFERFPVDWNTGYTLRYVYQGKLYHMRGTPVDDTIKINLIRVAERKVSLVSLNVRMVLKKVGTIEEMIPNYADIRSCIEKQLIEPVVFTDRQKHQETQTTSTVQTQESYSSWTSTRSAQGVDPGPGTRPIHPLAEPRVGGIGSSDLDPFFGGVRPLSPGRGGLGVGGGGGMLFPAPRGDLRGVPGPGANDPFGAGVPPPGARFDPLFVPEPDGNQRRPRNQGTDEFPPPEYGNMFM